MLSQSRTRCTLLPSQMPTPRIHNKVLPQKYLIVSQIHAGRNTKSLFPFVRTTPMHSCSIVQLNRVVRRANATLELNEFKEFTHQDVRIFQIVKEQLNGDCPHLFKIVSDDSSTEKGTVPKFNS